MASGINSVTTAFPFASWMVGFDQHLDLINKLSSRGSTYPPYNIVKKDEDTYIIEIALAGFKSSDLSITELNSLLTIEGKAEEAEKEYLYKGIGSRGFKQDFMLAEHVKVKSADFKDGILSVTVIRELPESERPKSIPIGNGIPVSKPKLSKYQYPEIDSTTKWHEKGYSKTKKEITQA